MKNGICDDAEEPTTFVSKCLLLDEKVETSQEISHRMEFCLHLCQWFPVLQTHTPVPYLHFARKSNTANIKEPAFSHINQIRITAASCYEIQLHYPSRWGSTSTQKHTCPPSEMPYRPHGIIIQDKKKWFYEGLRSVILSSLHLTVRTTSLHSKKIHWYNSYRKPNKMPQCIKILFLIYMKRNF